MAWASGGGEGDSAAAEPGCGCPRRRRSLQVCVRPTSRHCVTTLRPRSPMEPKIHRPQAQCSRTGRPFQPGDVIISTLVRSPEGLERTDTLATAWAGAAEKSVAWWRSTYPKPDSTGAVLAPNDVLLDLVEQLEGQESEAPLRYLLALQLVRRRVLRFVDQPAQTAPPADAPPPPEAEPLRLACRKRDCEYLVKVAPPEPATAAAVEARLAALLWSGDAA